ncbi:hypothetical protein LJR231_000314 [Phyllobacterium sp. LjRoot231]|uniref:hypothetical protein n=1 Tax=Phyllobacterium sp. LjRoot231 TaxID=3342289 RepID=UPI003ED056C5
MTIFTGGFMHKFWYALALTTVFSIAWMASLAAEPTKAMPTGQETWISQEDALANPDIVVTVDLNLDRNGRITGPLKVGGSGENRDALKRAMDGAQRAVRRGAPYKLPANKYKYWKNTHFTFHADPNWKGQKW